MFHSLGRRGEHNREENGLNHRQRTHLSETMRTALMLAYFDDRMSSGIWASSRPELHTSGVPPELKPYIYTDKKNIFREIP
jgi:hypothetical protein